MNKEEEWEWDEEEVENNKNVNVQPNIKIEGNLIKIDHKEIDWSDDEFDSSPPPVPPPPPLPIPPPPPPPLPVVGKTVKSEKLDSLKKRPTKRPDWNDLMQEIEKFRCNRGLLKKSVCSDRSEPILTQIKIKGNFVYESEKDTKNANILKEIKKGARLRHVKCNDRSKPNLRGIKAFKRQLTREEKVNQGIPLAEELLEEKDELEEYDKLRDDLESTKQLLELEVRSKQLLEKDNKKLQSEIEKMKIDLEKMKNLTVTEEFELPKSLPDRKDSVPEKRKSIIRHTSESKHEALEEVETTDEVYEIEELKEEADEARRLAEEWELKYKEMQRQLEELETRRINSENTPNSEEDISENKGEDWMYKRESFNLQIKIRNLKDKKDFIKKERKLLDERLENLKECIFEEISSRKCLKREIKDMNAAFKKEMADMEALEQTEEELKDVYISDDEDLVSNVYAGKKEDPYTVISDFEEDEIEITVEDITRNADEIVCEHEDEGIKYFYQEEDLEDTIKNVDKETILIQLEKQSEIVQAMRKSNFILKSKIDVLCDALQVQKEKHQDLKLDLNRMLTDIQ